MPILTFLGTGTSQGVPIIGCPCPVCTSSDFRNHRLRTSALLRFGHSDIVIDAGPDFRYQILREGVKNVDAILLTHPHRDHVGGLDDVRPFNYYQQRPMPIYGNSFTLESLRQSLSYAFDENPYPGAPRFDPKPVEDEVFEVCGEKFTAFSVMHYKMRINAYRVRNLAYITDASEVDDKALGILAGLDVLVVNALRWEPHISHFTIGQALDLVEKVHPARTYLTHMGHTLDFQEVSAMLPHGVELAYDGLQIEF